MVCIMCLLPLFLVPIVNVLPLLFDYLVGKFYALFGWEYRKPERVPPACPYKPPVSKDNSTVVEAENEPKLDQLVPESGAVGIRDKKQD